MTNNSDPMTAAQIELWAGKQGGSVGERERPNGPTHSIECVSGNVASRQAPPVRVSVAPQAVARRAGNTSAPLTKRPTKCAKLRALLADGCWHSMRELQDVAGWRYAARVFDCKIGRDGGEPMDHETKRDDAGCRWYRRKGATQ